MKSSIDRMTVCPERAKVAGLNIIRYRLPISGSCQSMVYRSMVQMDILKRPLVTISDS